MRFAYPQLTGVAAVAALLALLAVVVLVRKQVGLRRLAAHPTLGRLLHVRRPIQCLKALLLCVAAGLLGLAVLGPEWGHTEQEAEAASGRDLLIVLDVSRSMLAEDVQPNRLERAKADLRDLVAALEQKGGHRVGLIAFADRAALFCPLTSDYRCFDEELTRATLAGLRLRGEGSSADGTQIGQALARAAQAIDKPMAAWTEVLLVSDGGDLEADTLDAAKELTKLGVRVHSVGLGDPEQGALIPAPNGKGYLTFEGQPVRTRLEEKVLREVSTRTGGNYLAVGKSYVPLERWFESAAADRTTRELAPSGKVRLPIHRFQWFVLPVLGLLLLELFLSEAGRATGATVQPNYFKQRWRFGGTRKETVNV